MNDNRNQKIREKCAIIVTIVVLWGCVPVIIVLSLPKTPERTVTYEDIELSNGYCAQIATSSEIGIAYVFIYQIPRPYFSGTLSQRTHEFSIFTRHQQIFPKTGDIFFIAHTGEIVLLSNIKANIFDADVLYLLEELVVQLQRETAIEKVP